MLNLSISELRLIAKARNTDGYKNMSKKQLEDLFTKPQRSKTPNKPISVPSPKSLYLHWKQKIM